MEQKRSHSLIENTSGTEIEISTPSWLSLARKAGKSSFPLTVVEQVYCRGIIAAKYHPKQTLEQQAFNRVDSFLHEGKAYELDQDLVLETPKVPDGKKHMDIIKNAIKNHETKNQLQERDIGNAVGALVGGFIGAKVGGRKKRNFDSAYKSGAASQDLRNALRKRSERSGEAEDFEKSHSGYKVDVDKDVNANQLQQAVRRPFRKVGEKISSGIRKIGGTVGLDNKTKISYSHMQDIKNREPQTQRPPQNNQSLQNLDTPTRVGLVKHVAREMIARKGLEVGATRLVKRVAQIKAHQHDKNIQQNKTNQQRYAINTSDVPGQGNNVPPNRLLRNKKDEHQASLARGRKKGLSYSGEVESAEAAKARRERMKKVGYKNVRI
jgi:uncharacterized protein YcfJ